jgi:hypothetical protein
LISSGVQAGASYLQSSQRQSQLSHQQGQAIGAGFENLVSQAKALFASIDAKGPYITAEDFNAALAAYQTLESFVQQYPIEYVTTQWNSSAYSQAAQNYLAKFQATLVTAQSSGGAVGGGGQSSVSPPPSAPATETSMGSIAAVAALALLTIALVRKNESNH